MSRRSPSAPPACPPSDVSTGVGLVGVAGLAGWVLFCRNWGAIADALALSPMVPRTPMSGPNAALAAMLFTATPMVLWSIFIDKVHRRPSTGLAWDAPRPFAASWRLSLTRLVGLWSSWALIAAVFMIGRWYWQPPYLFAMHVLGALVLPLLALSVPYVLWLDRHMIEPRDGAWHFGALLIGREPCDREAVLAHLRGWAVKGFFTAFMISILPAGFARIVTMDSAGFGRDPVETCSWLIEAMFLVDVQIAMVGYVLTLRPLDAQIRSANPLLAGWVAALICYPPFVLMGNGSPLDYHPFTADWPHWLAGRPLLMWLWCVMLAALTGIYAWATVAFGLRFSNLTYRGVLTHGPYRLTRHPAYLSKNLFWWLATLPFFATNGSTLDALRNTVILGLVSATYYWRAKTEERHLGAEDAKYRAYREWMEDYGPVTRAIGWLTRPFAGRAPQMQPAE